MKTLTTAILSCAAAIALAAPASAQRNGDFRPPGGGYGNGAPALQGLSVDQAKAQLASAGYVKARNINSGGRQYDLWSNTRSRDACLGFTSYNGRVTEARAFSDSECGVVGGGWGPGGFNESALRGLRVDDAKRNLRNFGYDHRRNVRIDGQQWDLWESSRGRDCVGFTSYNGIVSGAREFRRGECDGDWNSGGWGGRPLRLNDLIGLNVDQAKRELADSGFSKGRNISVRGQQWDLWYDERVRGDRCVGFTSYNGRVTGADNFPSRECY